MNKPSQNYPAGYAAAPDVQKLIEQLAENMLQKYPVPHCVRTDGALYDYALALKERFLRNSPPLNKVVFDSKLQVMKNALGMHEQRSRVQGAKQKSGHEIRIASVFREMPPEFLRMIVVHELAHLKEREHNKAFYQLCQHMEPDYHQLEFDLRAYLTYLDAKGKALWSHALSREKTAD